MTKRELKDRKFTKILGGNGDKNRADKIVQWSSKSQVGARLENEVAAGLSFTIIANGLSPSVELNFNPKKFQDLALSLKSDMFVLSSWGMLLEYRNPNIKLRLITVKGPQLFLWDSTDNATMVISDVKHLVGILRFSEDEICPTFWPAAEKKMMKEVCKPLLVMAGNAIPAEKFAIVDNALTSVINEATNKLHV